MFSWIQYIGGAFLGWSLGANDSANVFGTAVSSGMVKYSLAVTLTAVFVVIGALFQGQAGIATLSEELKHERSISAENSSISEKSSTRDRAVLSAVVASAAAAFTVTIMTLLRIPVSTSQAVVGAIIGVGIMQHNVRFEGVGKVLACWFGTPVGAAVLAVVFYYFFRIFLIKWKPNIFVYDPVLSLLLIVCGCYGAYALGANNVANVSAVFVGEGMLSVFEAALFGGLAIAVGALTYSKPVMQTVGKGITKLDSFSAFICVLAHAVTVHIYAIIGVPVSTSQAIIGAILGIAIIKGVHTIRLNTLGKVCAGWFATPFVAMLFACVGYFFACLQYQPI